MNSRELRAGNACGLTLNISDGSMALAMEFSASRHDLGIQ